MEREALGKVYGLKIFHHYCFVKEMSIITDHKPLVSIFKKRCDNIITEITTYSTKNTSIQGENHIYVWTRSIHGRLAIQTKSR